MEEKDYIGGSFTTPKRAEIKELDVTEPTVIMSKAIKDIEQHGNYKVLVAIVDLEDRNKPARECLDIFCDIESKSLREVIYRENEKGFAK